MILSEVEFRKGYLVLNIKKEEKIIQEFTFESFFFLIGKVAGNLDLNVLDLCMAY